MKYSEYLCDYLEQEGYTHCYFVAGGNIMHFLDAARTKFECVPVVHEVAAGIAAEYFNESSNGNRKAFALVTAGPGLTNIVTAMAGAYLESRELLVIGGQVKTSDLKSPELRQRGIQEIDGTSLVSSITRHSVTLTEPILKSRLDAMLNFKGRNSPVFLEIPLDIQATVIDSDPLVEIADSELKQSHSESKIFLDSISSQLSNAKRPLILLGGGLSRKIISDHILDLKSLGIPIMTTWNGADRYGYDLPNFWGRPNTWGQRSANLLIQQADFLLVIGSRLGLQQTGFAWQEFAPLAKIFQVDIDRNELAKGHPKIFAGLTIDASEFFRLFVNLTRGQKFDIDSWLVFGANVIRKFPAPGSQNDTSEGYIDPFEFVSELSEYLSAQDVIIPCSSGGAFTVTMQAFRQKYGQIIVTNKGLASMGYGLSGAIGAAQATSRRTILIEGDGGFSQNLQELGTVAQQKINLKIFIFANQGYASIRMTQKNYFQGQYLGCDTTTGLGLPNWKLIAEAYSINFSRFDSISELKLSLPRILGSDGPEFVLLDIDPDQTYFPKISSHISADGNMVSNPLHLMTPELSEDEIRLYLPYLADRILRQ
jgi:acetolactate synthase-1/2/3 large subunit